MTKSVNTREIILGCLLEIDSGEYSHLVLGNVLDKYQYLEKQERSFITKVTQGTVEHLIKIDYIINEYSKIKTKKMKPVIRNILRSAVYQIKYLDSIPNSAVCNEAVKLAVKKGFHQLKGFVNGVLRTIVRNMDSITYPNAEQFPIRALSIRFSMPEWIIEEWLKNYSFKTVEAILESFFNKKILTIRCNTRKIAPQDLMIRLEEEGVFVQQHPYLPYALQISGFDYIRKLKTFQDGLFQVQDVSSMLVTEVAAPKPGDLCVDVCAAPGGKSTHLAERIGAAGQVYARDLTEYKTALIEENRERMRLENIKVQQWDAREFDADMEERADVLLIDAPCSGLGIMGKKADIKYNISKEKQKSLTVLQREIIDNVWKYVKPGGTLVYSTCTIHPEENEEQVQWITENYPFKRTAVNKYLPKVLQKQNAEQEMLQLLPGIHACDGFFIAKLIRN